MILLDNESPSITCPSFPLTATGSNAFGYVNLVNPTATDNTPSISILSPPALVYETSPPGLAFYNDVWPVGTNVINYTVTDPAGNFASCSAFVTVYGTIFYFILYISFYAILDCC